MTSRMGLEAFVLSLLLNRGKVRIEELVEEVRRAQERGLLACRDDAVERLMRFIENLEARGTVEIRDGYVILRGERLSPVLKKLLTRAGGSPGC